MSHAATLLAASLAFALLALAMDRHQQALFGRALNPGSTRALRAVGWLALAGSLAIAMGALGGSLGLVVWFGHISAGAGLVMLALIAWERRKAGGSSKAY